MKSKNQGLRTRPDLLEDGIYRTTLQPARWGRLLSVGRPEAQVIDGSGLPDQSAIVLTDTRGLDTGDPNTAAAKRVVDREGVHYYIKFSTMGFDKGHMLNPYGMYFRQYELAAGETKIGKKKYEYKLVPSEAFYDYIEFLKSRNEAYLRRAERRVLDA